MRGLAERHMPWEFHSIAMMQPVVPQTQNDVGPIAEQSVALARSHNPELRVQKQHQWVCELLG